MDPHGGPAAHQDLLQGGRAGRGACDEKSGGWYVEDEAEAAHVWEKRAERRRNARCGARVEIEPTERLVEVFCKTFGNDKLKARNLRIIREARCYVWDRSETRQHRVEALNRLGSVKDERVYRLG